MGKKSKKLILVGLVLVMSLSLAGLSSVAASPLAPVEAEISFAEGVPLLPSVTPVVILEGSDYEMGYQYARQLTQIFGPWLLEHPIVHPHLTAERLTALKAYQYNIRKYAPEMIDFMKGMVAGAADDGISLTYEEALAQFWDVNVAVLDKEVFPSEAEAEQLPPEEQGCSGFAAWGSATKDGKIIAAGSSDGQDPMSVIMIWLPDEGNSFIWWGFSAMGKYFRGAGHPGMNEKGLMYVHHGCTAKRKEKSYGLQSTIRILHTLRFADNAKEAVDMQFSLETVSGASGLWADIDGNAFNIDRSEPPLVRKPGDLGEVDFLYATNTRTMEEVCRENEEFIPHRGCVKKDAKYRGDRNLQLYNMLTDYRGEIDFEFAKMLWRYREPTPIESTPDKWDKEAKAHYEEQDRAGWYCTIGRDTCSHIGIMIPDEMLFYHCVHYPAEQPTTWSPVSMHLQPYVPYAPRCFIQLKLASSPAEVAKAAQYQAEIDLFFANRELRKLDYWDPPYAPLDEIYNQALIEWCKGDFLISGLYGTIKWAPEDEAIYDWAKAARAFNRCQALARQVYNALVPPATSPEDLGLEPYQH